VRLTDALHVSVQHAVDGPSSGQTYVSLNMAHSNTHEEPVVITNVAMHPGHSRLDSPNSRRVLSSSGSLQGGQHLVTDMSRFVRWSYARGTEPPLPLVLHPHEAYSTVLIIEAGEDLRSRDFISPVSVTATIGDTKVEKPMVVLSATDISWHTGRVAVEPADAFRVDMSLKETQCYVGAPLVVSLKVLNLSPDSRDLMLLMAKDEESKKNAGSSQSKFGVNTAVVSEVNGYTFGVWGLSGDDDGTTRHNRDQELLAVDAALLLGEVKGQHTVEAELRFVPLREGTLDVPNMKLYDKKGGKWYNCVHQLKIVANPTKKKS